MTELEAPISDSAFYLSYYYDVVRAPSLASGFAKLLWDERSEAPDTVNALHKFNVIPELVVAATHRILGFSMSPYQFYVWCVVAAAGLGVVALSLTAFALGGLLCSAASVSMFFSLCFSQSMTAGTRFATQGGSVALREFWGIPALLLQNVCLVSALRPGPVSRASFAGLVFGTCVFELCWQFAPFVLLLQLLSLLGSHCLACLDRRRLGLLALGAVLGTGLGLVVSLGNNMLLCSPFFALAASVAVASRLPTPWQSKVGGLSEAVWTLSVAIGCGAIGHQLLSVLASGQEDQHVLQLLLEKLGLAPPNGSFDAFLYLQSPEFLFLDWRYVDEAWTCGVVPAFCVAVLLFVVAAWRRGQALDCPSSATDVPWAAWASQILFAIALCLLACLVSRLRVLAAPILCIVASLAGSQSLWVEATVRRRTVGIVGGCLCLALVVLPPLLSGAPARVSQVSEVMPDVDMRELVEWANRTLTDRALVMADMTMAAKFRMISPTIKVANHPQYESVTSRKRNRDYYRTFTCATPSKVHQVLSQYGVTHVLLNANACRARVGKLDAFHEPADQCGTVPMTDVRKRSFCWGGWISHSPGLFTLAFRNPVYTVLQVSIDAGKSRTRRGGALTDVGTWKQWLPHLDDGAARGLARSAVDWPSKYGGFEVAELMMSFAEERAPEDPIVLLQRGRLQLALSDKRAAHESMSRAAKLAGRAAVAAGKAEAGDLLSIYSEWKNHLGAKDKKLLRKLARSLSDHLEATHNAFDLCDTAAMLTQLGERPLAKQFWNAAKGISRFDQCVREDWASWEGQVMSDWDVWGAFFGW